ncbi:S-layer protein SlpA [Clostridioides sp. ZZV14-6387]|uniref:S-layer protein SlpA n=1 Tax=Clostridioides sp. ZZV14-6387 TaxID=2811497 RepID=UPI001D117A0A|nr:S-layer protein SlpA [Clostridioides sp. ZZV14-6387]
MNKKNLAMAMAAVTVVGSAAPVFAAGDVQNYTISQNKYEKAVKELQDGLLSGQIKTIGVSFNGSIVATIDPTKETVGTTGKTQVQLASEKLKSLVDDKLDNLGDGDYVDFDIAVVGESDKADAEYFATLTAASGTGSMAASTTVAVPAGTAQDDGVVGNVGASGGADNTSTTALTFKDVFDAKISGNSVKISIKPAIVSSGIKIGKVDTGVKEYTLVNPLLSNGETEMTLNVGDTKLDLSQTVTLDKATGKFSAFATSATVGADKNIKLRVVNAKEEIIDIDANSYREAKDLAERYVFVKSDIEEIITALKALDNNGTESNLIQKVSSKYQVSIFAEGKRLNTKSASLATPDSPLKATIKADRLKDLIDYFEDLKTYNNGYSNSVTVAGEDRIETAIELCNKYYNSTDDNAVTDDAVNNLVLVGSQSIVDGLVASPLASEKKAPLLLTSKDKLDASVKSEIKRVMNLKSTTGVNTSKKVYLAGGVNSISKEVENELKDLGLKVTRLAGDDRYATSLEIADEIGLDNDKAYVVGGTGLADAMSIAPVASQIKNGHATPIVVVDGKAKEINEATKDFLDDSDVDVIGGENSVSKDVERSIDDATGKAPDRISGEDRQATNAKVIKEYFKYNADVENFFVAKDGSTKEDQLVDALAAAPVAANFDLADGVASPAPIVLATDSLSTDQTVAVSKAVKAGGAENLVQVGKGISSSLITKLKDLLDM